MSNPAMAPINNPGSEPEDEEEEQEEEEEEEEFESTGTWDSDDSEDTDQESDDDLRDYISPNEEYWEENNAADAWLAKFQGGTPLLYPKLFVVKPRRGQVVTPSRHPDRVQALLGLPVEIRNQIYRLYFDGYDVGESHANGGMVPFYDSGGNKMHRICLSSENVELKFWLSTALLQSSRQLRSEATSVLFANRVITAEWLPSLPRFANFLGKEGCAMVRYLDIWDSLNLQGHNNSVYQDIISNIMHFPHIIHLRIMLAWDDFCGPVLESDRGQTWFDRNEWTDNRLLRVLTNHAVPKMRYRDVEQHWRECDILMNLKAEKFTLAVEGAPGNSYLEFDKNYEVYPDISQSMKGHASRVHSALLLAPRATSISLHLPEAFQALEIRPRAESDGEPGEDSDSPTWQDTDSLANKTIPFYNFFRQLFHDNISLQPPQGGALADNFYTFPTARKSTGSIMRNCPMCYLNDNHCGYHTVPDQLPFEPKCQEGDDEQDFAKTLAARFDDLSYLDMRQACRDVVHRAEAADNRELVKVYALLSSLGGWIEPPNSELLDRLDAAVDLGWAGKRLDKDEVPPWDMLYREFYSRQ